MALRGFTHYLQLVNAGTINPYTALWKAALLMTNTDFDTADNANLGVGTIDRCDSSGYADKTLGSLAATEMTGYSKLTCADLTWTALPTCTRQVQGILYYVEVSGSDAGRIPAFFDGFATNKTPDGSDFTVKNDTTYGFGYLAPSVTA